MANAWGGYRIEKIKAGFQSEAFVRVVDAEGEELGRFATEAEATDFVRRLTGRPPADRG